MKKSLRLLFLIVVLCFSVLSSCSLSRMVAGHYSYQHGWEYPMREGYLRVHETGTMDFYNDGSAIDSAQQVYRLTTPDSTLITCVFNYVSPSCWSLENEDFLFSGIAASFRMVLVNSIVEGDTLKYDHVWVDAFSHQVIHDITQGIEQRAKFHLDSLNRKMMQWGYVYPDGHRDTWEFYR